MDALHSWELVEPQVRTALAARLGFAARDLGQPAYRSEVISAVQAIPGVDYVDVTAFTGVSDTITPVRAENLVRGFGQQGAPSTEPTQDLFAR